MKKTGKWIILASALLLAGGLVTGITFADSDWRFQKAHWRKGFGHRGWGFTDPDRIKKQLDLTDEQTEKIRTIVTETRKKAVKVRADLRVARIELAQLLTQTEVDRAAVDQKVGQIDQTIQQMIRLGIDTYFDVREILTPEQREKAKPFIHRMLSAHRGRFH